MTIGRSRRRWAAVVALGLLGGALAGSCSSDSTSDDTLGPLDGSAATATGIPTGTAPPDSAAPATPTPAAGPAGAGVVRLAVRLSSSGTDEILLLDRGTVAADQLDPVSLDAACTALDGGPGLTVSVIDLSRVTAGQRLLSASLRVDGDVAGAGDYTGMLEVGDADQQLTRFEGAVRVDEGLASGTFDLVDGAGNSATGSFACAADQASLPTTTTMAPAPASDVTTEGGTAGTPPPSIVIATTPSIVIVTTPPPTVPQATS